VQKRCDGTKTRERILEAAANLFAERGFQAATHAEIARRSGVNSALLNYHFTDKTTLYRKAWEFAQERTAQKYPALLSNSAPAEERFRELIRTIVQAAADPMSADQEIWRKELAQPTGLLSEIRQKTVVPLRKQMGTIVRELLGEGAAEESVRLATMSVIAQCRTPILNSTPNHTPPNNYTSPNNYTLPNASSNAPNDDRFVDVNLEQRIEHIYQFSLGGIKALRRNLAPSGESASER